MAANQVTFAPNTTTSPQNSFVLEAGGWIQGMELDNQPSRMQRDSGLLINATQPVWGGMMVNLYIPNINQNGQGCNLKIATAQETDYGFVTFASAYNMILVPGNDVPSALNDGTVLYYPNGKWTRLPVQCSSSLAAALEGGLVCQAVYWDFTTQTLTNTGRTPIPGARIKGFNSNSLIVNYNSTTGALTWSVGTCALLEF